MSSFESVTPARGLDPRLVARTVLSKGPDMGWFGALENAQNDASWLRTSTGERHFLTRRKGSFCGAGQPPQRRVKK
jgi:hypothetical protein